MSRLHHTSRAALLALFVFGASHLPGTGLASRPFVTEGAGVTGRGRVQLESAWEYVRWNRHGSEQIVTLIPFFGVTDEVELGAEIPFMFHNHEQSGNARGIGDISMVTKFLLASEQHFTPAIALKTVLKTTTGNVEHGLGSGALDYSLIAAASKTLNDVAVHAMFGYTFVGSNGDQSVRDTFSYGWAVEYAVSHNSRLLAEFAGNRHPDRMTAAHMQSAMIGAAHDVSDSITLDVAARIGTSESAPRLIAAIGLTWTM